MNLKGKFLSNTDQYFEIKGYAAKFIYAYFLLSADDIHRAINADWIHVNGAYYHADKNVLRGCYIQITKSKEQKMKFHLELREIKNPYLDESN